MVNITALFRPFFVVASFLLVFSACKSPAGATGATGAAGVARILIIPASDLRNRCKAAVEYIKREEVKTYYNLPD